MVTRQELVFVLAAVLPSMGASFRTTNFIVDAPTSQIAQQIAQAAERYRREKAVQWLGQEMPNWGQPCPVRVSVTMNGAGGATSFAFDQGAILSQDMHIEGSLERLVSSVLPHEITHTVFAYHFRQPVPRWADEGGAVLSEDDQERHRHDQMCRQILNSPGRKIPLRRLFTLREYPGDMEALYAEGFSVANFLVSSSNRPTFLNFVADGIYQGWDRAVQSHYRYRSVDELEEAWLKQLRDTRRQPGLLANNTNPGRGNSPQQVMVRQTAPPVQPLLDAPMPIYRGQMGEQDGQRFNDPPRGTLTGRPGYLPDYNQPQNAQWPTQDRWQPAAPAGPPTVRLGPPQFGPR